MKANRKAITARPKTPATSSAPVISPALKRLIRKLEKVRWSHDGPTAAEDLPEARAVLEFRSQSIVDLAAKVEAIAGMANGFALTQLFTDIRALRHGTAGPFDAAVYVERMRSFGLTLAAAPRSEPRGGHTYWYGSHNGVQHSAEFLALQQWLHDARNGVKAVTDHLRKNDKRG